MLGFTNLSKLICLLCVLSNISDRDCNVLLLLLMQSKQYSVVFGVCHSNSQNTHYKGDWADLPIIWPQMQSFDFEACLRWHQNHPRITLSIFCFLFVCFFLDTEWIWLIWQSFWSPFVYNLSHHQKWANVYFCFLLVRNAFSFWALATICSGSTTHPPAFSPPVQAFVPRHRRAR